MGLLYAVQRVACCRKDLKRQRIHTCHRERDDTSSGRSLQKSFDLRGNPELSRLVKQSKPHISIEVARDKASYSMRKNRVGKGTLTERGHPPVSFFRLLLPRQMNQGQDQA